MFVFWHGGFPLFALRYALLPAQDNASTRISVPPAKQRGRNGYWIYLPDTGSDRAASHLPQQPPAHAQLA